MILVKPLVLASASPRRKELLASLGLEFTVIPSSVDEDDFVERLGETAPDRLVQELALAKALDVFSVHLETIVIGADTVVVVDDQVLGKPADEAGAHTMLNALSGRTHEVFTGIAVVTFAKARSASVRTSVTFKKLSKEEIAAYIATGETMDKAGAYGIQNRAISPVASIEGDYYNVVGLPIDAVRKLLLEYYPQMNPCPPQPKL